MGYTELELAIFCNQTQTSSRKVRKTTQTPKLQHTVYPAYKMCYGKDGEVVQKLLDCPG